MWFDVLLQCEGHAGIWCSMAETGIHNFLPNLVSAKPQPSREEGLWGHESPIILKKKKASMIRMHNIFASQLPTECLWLTEGWMVALRYNAGQRYWRLQDGGSYTCVISRRWKLYFPWDAGCCLHVVVRASHGASPSCSSLPHWKWCTSVERSGESTTV